VADDWIPGEPAVWVLIWGDFLVFGLFFCIFSYYRAHNFALYSASQHTMHRGLGFANTLVLLTSSWFVAQSVRDVRNGAKARGARLILGAIFCGLCFCVIKVFDYRASVYAGITLNTNEFYTLYFMLTGIHLVHVIIGTGVLVYMYALVSKRPVKTKKDIVALESGGVFWHLIDILWVFLFALFYLMV